MNLKGFIIFALVIYLSFWLGSVIVGFTGINSMGTAGLLAASLVPIGIGYYVWSKYGKKHE